MCFTVQCFCALPVMKIWFGENMIESNATVGNPVKSDFYPKIAGENTESNGVSDIFTIFPTVIL